MRVQFTILGEPVGKGRPRFSTKGNFVKAYTPKKTVNYENLVKLEYRRQCRDFKFPKEAPLDLRILAYFGIPKSASKRKRELMISGAIRPMKKPDMDNVIKAIADACNEYSYHDDAQIVDCQVRKFYSEQPRVTIIIQEVKMVEQAKVQDRTKDQEA